MSGRTRVWLGAWTGLGLAASAAALYTHAKLLSQPGYVSACDVSAAVSCSQVYLSRFGTLAGVPVALWGLAWFGLVALLLAAAGRGASPFREHVASYLLVLSIGGVGVILYLSFASLVILHAVCLFCLATYAAVVGILAISALRQSQPIAALPRLIAMDVKVLIGSARALALVAAFSALLVVAAMAFPHEAPAPGGGTQAAPSLTDAQRSEFDRWFAEQPRVPLPVDPEGAKVLVVKFTDYQCPACARTYVDYQPILAKYAASRPGDVKFVELDYPLNPACNASVRSVIHPAACEAAVAVRLARVRGKGDDMEAWLAENHASLTPHSIKQAAQTIGGVSDFDDRYASVIEAVKADAALGGLNGVKSTPTFFVNGTMVPPLAPRFFDRAIALAFDAVGR